MTPTDTPDEPYAVDTPLTNLLGTHAKVKLLAALASERGRDVNVTDLANMAGVARSTVYENLDDLLDLGVVERTRSVGNAAMYQLDESSEISKRIWELEGLVLKKELEIQSGRHAASD